MKETTDMSIFKNWSPVVSARRRPWFRNTLLLVLAICASFADGKAQCPPLEARTVSWEAAELDSDSREAVLVTIRKTLDRYCAIADLYDADLGVYSEEKGRAFLELLGPSQWIADDLQTGGEATLSPAQYRDKVYQYFYQTGVQFRLEDPQLKEVRRMEQYLVATIHLRKRMFNGLDRRYAYKDLSGKPREMELVMELRIRLGGSGSELAVIHSISEVAAEREAISVGRYLDLQVGGLTDIGTGWEAAEPWTALALPRPDHKVLHVEGLYSAPLGKGEHWYWSVGLGIRRGEARTVLQEDLSIQSTAALRELGSQTYNVPFTSLWQFNAGSEVLLAYTAVVLPLGLRWNPSPDFRREWLVDLHLIPGMSLFAQDYEGDIRLAYGYGGNLDCSYEGNFRRGDVRSSWTTPMVHLRFSPGYYGTIPNWSRSSRNLGWFLRLDAEMGLLPMFRREGGRPWVSLENVSNGQGRPVFDQGAAPLHRTHTPLLIGLRGGLFWKFF